jgi:tetratricopeptide (TPR) repeat protein
LADADLASTRLRNGEEVLDLISEARRSYPDNCQLIYLQGRALMRADRHQEAMECFDQLLAVDVSTLPALDGPSYDERIFSEFTHNARGACLFRLGLYREAADAFGAAALAAPDNIAYGAKRQVALGRLDSLRPSTGGSARAQR